MPCRMAPMPCQSQEDFQEPLIIKQLRCEDRLLEGQVLLSNGKLTGQNFHFSGQDTAKRAITSLAWQQVRPMVRPRGKTSCHRHLP